MLDVWLRARSQGRDRSAVSPSHKSLLKILKRFKAIRARSRDQRCTGSRISDHHGTMEVEGDEIDIRKPGVFYLLRRLRLGGASKTRLNSWTTEEGCELSPLSTYGRGLGGGSLDVPFCTDVTLLRFPPPNKGQGLCHWQGYIPLPKENCTPRP